ncbi:MAG TPA: hypothetical protein VGB95_06285 [Chitinophagales bacterium]
MNIILALYPNARGLGFACLEAPQKLIEYGIVTVRPIYNTPLLRRMEHFLDFFRPQVVILRDGDSLPPSNSRVKQLLENIAQSAERKGIPVHYYSREQIKGVFSSFNASTKYEIAQKLVEWFPEVEDKVPALRKPWESENYYMGIFDALSLGLTHIYLS